MLINYTILYLFILYIGQFFEFFSPGLMPLLALIREGYLFFLIIIFIYKLGFVIKNKLTKQVIMLSFFVLISLFFILRTNNVSAAISSFLLFYSGPLIFLIMSGIKIDEKAYNIFEIKMRKLLLFLCYSGLLFYFIQAPVVNLLPEEKKTLNFYHLTNNYKLTLRMLGIGFHPTSTGFLYIYAFSRFLFCGKNRIKSCLFFVGSYLTRTRSALVGIPGYIFVKSNNILKFFYFILGMAFLAFMFFLFKTQRLFKYIDGSAIIHLYDLFIYGPESVLANITGAGIGTVSPYNLDNPIIHLESDLYLILIQVGIIPFIFLFIFFLIIIRNLKMEKNSFSKYLLFILTSYLFGCIIFPLHSLRFISNYVWIEIGWYYARKNWTK